MDTLEERVSEVLKGLKYVLVNSFTEEYEDEVKAAINLIYELEGMRHNLERNAKNIEGSCMDSSSLAESMQDRYKD